ncbi:MAG: hypothetical protein OJF49_000816 [Ktedonobacterales bacterium]|nr:MAG: hypothetical protein OJF49_000816 [Ktedonobacterales bacterium]
MTVAMSQRAQWCMVREREAEYAARWASGAWRGVLLRAATGASYTLVYEGRAGGPAGPDFRDAVLLGADGTRLYGDIELHLRASGWRQHGHDRDPRYNNVVLHVLVRSEHPAHGGDFASPTPLASGGIAATVALDAASSAGHAPQAWPCARLAQRCGGNEVKSLLIQAGLRRFTERAAVYAQALEQWSRVGYEPGEWTAVDRALFVALAEALAYGRDREALRQAGEQLAAGQPADALLAEVERLPRVERARLLGLLRLHTRWRRTGPWLPLRSALARGSPQQAGMELVELLRVHGGEVSAGRARIVAANVSLPFAAAYANTREDAALAARAQAVYLALPGLPSNTITRLMSRQIGLARLPAGAAAQLGLHDLWSRWCREKRCAECQCAHLAPASRRS